MKTKRIKTANITIPIPTRLIEMLVTAINNCHEDEDGYRLLTVNHVLKNKKAMNAIGKFITDQFDDHYHFDAVNAIVESFYNDDFGSDELHDILDHLPRK